MQGPAVTPRDSPGLRPIRLGVCVDDFGLHPHVNEAALSLACTGRISALSCLVDAPAWRSGAAELGRCAAAHVDVGLHLNLTEAFDSAQSRLPLPALIARAYAGWLDAGTVTTQIRAQLDAFEDTIGAAPDFVDGHQHVHQLPVIRDALLAELVRRRPHRLPWLRRTRPPQAIGVRALLDSGGLKQRLIAALGEAALTHAAAECGFRQNRHLLGVYGFGGAAGDYADHLSRWCQQAQDNDLLMCHPATGADRRDIIAAARQKEYAVLHSERLGELLAARALVVVRLSTSLSTSPSNTPHGVGTP